MKQIIEIITDDGGLNLYNTISSSFEVHTKQLDETKKHLDIIKNLKAVFPMAASTQQFDDYKTVLEFNALLNIAILDLGLISKQLYLTKVNWESLFYSKQGYSIICATLERYEKQVNMVRKLISSKADHLDDEYRAIGKELSKFKKDYKYETHMKSVRNETAAHIEDFLLYYNKLLSIDPISAVHAIIAFVNLLGRFIKFSNLLLNASKIE